MSAAGKHLLTTPRGTFRLRRHQVDPDPSLRAWDAADEYLLDHVAEAGSTGGRVLVVNDAFGALATASTAAGSEVVSWNDSVLAASATLENLADNDLPPATIVASTSVPEATFDTVVLKVPRIQAFLDEQLHLLRPLVRPDTLVVAGAMTKHVHSATVEAFEATLGPTPTTRARKKARLLTAALDPDLEPVVFEPWRAHHTGEITVHARTNVFSAERLDAGSKLLLDAIGAPDAGTRVLDLGTGTGVLAATLLARTSDLAVTAVDESHHAVASATRTLAGVTSSTTPAPVVVATDVLDGIDGPFDLVVVNPPFHAGGARTSGVPRRMIDEAHRVLRPGGRIMLVGNRHLRYDVALRHVFGASEVLTSDSRYVVVAATR